MTLSTAELYQLIASFLWPFTRIAALLMTMTFIGTRMVPAQIRLMLAVWITVMIHPLLPAVPAQVELVSLQNLIILLQQLLIGIAIGLISELVQQSFMLGGQILSMQSSLSFATMMDPASGVATPVLGQLLQMATTLIFIGLDGHLVLIEMIVASFHSLPISLEPMPVLAWRALAEWGQWVFTAGLMMSLSAVLALLLINIALGVMTKVAPQLNIFSLGFAITLIAGLILCRLLLSELPFHFELQWQRGIELACRLLNQDC